jgi:hypothetical protein
MEIKPLSPSGGGVYENVLSGTPRFAARTVSDNEPDATPVTGSTVTSPTYKYVADEALVTERYTRIAVMLYPAEASGAVPNVPTVTVVVVVARLIDAAGLGADSSRTAPNELMYVYT